MPLTIPYNPSLVLGSVINQEQLDTVIDIAKVNAPINTLEIQFFDSLQLKRSLDMTLRELINMKLDTSQLEKEITKVKSAISESAIKMAQANIESWPKLLELQKKISMINSSVESPVDYSKSKIISLPLSSDSLEMNAQYFSFDKNKQNSELSISAMKSFVAASAKYFGHKIQSEVSKTASEQLAHQMQMHNVQGTLVITANCTHRNAQYFSPLVLDVDKSIQVWNALFPSKSFDKANMGGFLDTVERDSLSGKDHNVNSMNIISGASFGSSFVGMVHILKRKRNKVNQTVNEGGFTDSFLGGIADIGNWLANINGKFGIDKSSMKDLKDLLGKQEILSTVSLITKGVISSLTSQEVQIGVKEFTNFDPAQMMENLITAHKSIDSNDRTMETAARSARIGGEMISIRSAEIEGVMNGLADIDDGKNKVLNINSLMTAFESYCSTASSRKGGIPINFFVKPITAKQLAQMWMKKYFPDDSSNQEVENSSSHQEAQSSPPHQESEGNPNT